MDTHLSRVLLLGLPWIINIVGLWVLHQNGHLKTETGIISTSQAKPHFPSHVGEQHDLQTWLIRLLQRIWGYRNSTAADNVKCKQLAETKGTLRQQYWPSDVALTQVFMWRRLLDEELHLCWHIQCLIVRKVSTCGGRRVRGGIVASEHLTLDLN